MANRAVWNKNVGVVCDTDGCYLREQIKITDRKWPPDLEAAPEKP